MDDRGEVSPRSDAPRPRGVLARLFAPRRQVRESADRKGNATQDPKPEGEKKVPATRKAIECPECGAAAIIRDKGNSMIGVGMCGHEYIFKMVKIHCAAGHKLDALDEEGSVHDPNTECKERAIG